VTEPALWGLRRTALDQLDKLHLARPAVRLYELALAAKSELLARRTRDASGLPLPPARLRAQIGPRQADAELFLSSGRRHADLIKELVGTGGSSIEDFDAILDWGCGCGRIIRHWAGLPRTRVFGCDINAKLVAWCNEHLAFADVQVNDVSPPLPYPNATFDLVYALSVLTHLPEDLQHAWVRECFRVLKPGGYLLISTMGEYYLSLKRLSHDERRSFQHGEVVVLYKGAPGTSLCSAYHPPAYVRDKLAADFELVEFRPAVVDGRHDLHLLRKPALDHAPVPHS
jgi:SAM-dependent methyltransferase